MYWFDVRQQFGLPGVILAAIGFVYVLWRWPARGALLLLLYAANLAFAWTYNVGDVYIFFLPSHYVIALCAGAGIAAVVALAARTANRGVAVTIGALLLVYPAWRGYDTLPAVDRSGDRRAEQLLDEFTRDAAAVYGVDTNWQVQNAFEYFMRKRHPGTPWFYTGEFEWLERADAGERFRTFVNANVDIDRTMLVAPGVYRKLTELGYNGEVRLAGKPRDFTDRVKSIPTGTPYVLGILRPDREYPIDAAELGSAWSWLTGGSVELPAMRHFVAVAGRIGSAPVAVRTSDEPFRFQAVLEPFSVNIRMESWLPTDTIRRAGFGHVISGRTHVLTLERGLSFVALTPAVQTAYSSALFAPIPRYLLGIRRQP
jgi:hypothetical protein